MFNIACQPSEAIVHPAVARNGAVIWQTRYDGLVAVAYMGGKAIAGISGPWSERYALTWWGLPPAACELELFDSLEAAQSVVNARAKRMACGRVAIVHETQPRTDTTTRSWLDHIRALLPNRRRDAMASPVRSKVEHLRLQQLRQDMDISGLHFGATE